MEMHAEYEAALAAHNVAQNELQKARKVFNSQKLTKATIAEYDKAQKVYAVATALFDAAYAAHAYGPNCTVCGESDAAEVIESDKQLDLF